MISLGKYDTNLSASDIEAYLTLIEKFDRNVAGKKLIADKSAVSLKPLQTGESPSVAEVQTLLR